MKSKKALFTFKRPFFSSLIFSSLIPPWINNSISMLLCFIAILLSEKLEHGLLAYIYWALEELKANFFLQFSLKMHWQIYRSPDRVPNSFVGRQYR